MTWASVLLVGRGQMKEVAGQSIVRVVISEASPKPGSLGLYFATDSEELEALTAHTTPPSTQCHSSFILD